ncbi:Leu/Phe/Val dehydrogenase [Natronobacterium gregoryi]|uniref:Glu/Leu/Phe/Val dehydrogenase n=2 Tax=Natronobacterium gregoryi TaxID=44930 RepID=L0AKZ4_NATGS|nr:Glu/Leu/Phe/Val dehydrogenase dimerization domain-containing protein [Natronobacterium gregoryi]AFZ74476.1 glutamate dehydrogenase/leucine dehydrogenase [Natronobacterium gregoryi SP2]ELY72454.1 Glu/Leu/Phe/Val dehydrogenase [Natronobacterium gregoryi SP2]PLK21777.1 Glu/Leu/Phe/Val dehydrogenase [Natronobacterium gregoryi SP2]SFJ45703.1 leucine dehydrogenase [Natronobacterium gregoryi]
MVLDSMVDGSHEQVTYVSDPETGLRAIVAIHDTTLGPSLGGTRFLDYDTEADALDDVLGLSRAMTYKAAAADLPLGGGKAVILGDPDEHKTDALLGAYGRAIENLGGRYVTSVDVNTGVTDMDVVARETDHVVGTSNGLGDPSPITAHGVYHGICASAEHILGTDTPGDLEVVVQGLGKVGRALAEELVSAGAEVTVSDVDEDHVASFVDEHGVDSVAPEAVYEQSCDVFAPCAVGGVVNDDTIPQLECDIVAGSANNVLAERRHAEALRERGLFYAPDYVINAGGLMTVAEEYQGGSRKAAYEDAAAIGNRLGEMIEIAERQDTTVLDAAEEYAIRRIERAGSGDEPAVAAE